MGARWHESFARAGRLAGIQINLMKAAMSATRTPRLSEIVIEKRGKEASLIAVDVGVHVYPQRVFNLTLIITLIERKAFAKKKLCSCRLASLGWTQ